MRMPARALWILSLLALICSCNKGEEQRFSFYHWKRKATNTPAVNSALKKATAETIYLHYFDIDALKNKSYYDDGIYPVSVLKEVDEEFKQYSIVPVIFITNKVFKQEIKLEELSNRIYELVKQISMHHFKKMPESIQLDCDWTETTREKYFNLIKLQKEYYDVSATIRLHQIKYKERTGVPPVNRGVLMLYNVGKLEDDNQNSILESAVVGEYINSQTSYPMELDVALPLFSQVVVKNNVNEIRLLNGVDRNSLESRPNVFKPVGKNNFEVVSDTLYKGLYLFKGYKLKTEEVKVDEIVKSYSIIKNSKIYRGDIIFYHLDDPVLNNIDFENLLNQL